MNGYMKDWFSPKDQAKLTKPSKKTGAREKKIVICTKRITKYQTVLLRGGSGGLTQTSGAGKENRATWRGGWEVGGKVGGRGVM